ncbi:MAG TPA: tRNA(Ile)-lysidine synthetase, partial [Clostridiales bacterium]|nr:tRNA(Ile)-lysidine synthetase [Clostridiales bacterium]
MKLNEDLLIGRKSVAVALSGGKDSMALLNLLLESKTFKGQVKAINVEHGMRGENSVKDSEFVKRYCEQKNVPLKCYTVNALEYS